MFTNSGGHREKKREKSNHFTRLNVHLVSLFSCICFLCVHVHSYLLVALEARHLSRVLGDDVLFTPNRLAANHGASSYLF